MNAPNTQALDALLKVAKDMRFALYGRGAAQPGIDAAIKDAEAVAALTPSRADTVGAEWTLVSEQLPDHAEFGPYPTVDVILQLDKGFGGNGTPALRRHGHAQLRYLGDDQSRPYWTDEKANPIENTSWRVVYWRRIPAYPPPAAPVPGFNMQRKSL